MASLPEEVLRGSSDRTGLGLVAVSGGADSVALLRILVACAAHDHAPLLVAHLNHQLRGAESTTDEAFVRQLAAEQGVDYRTISMDVRGAAEASGDNLEDTARRIRYDWLTQLALEVGANWIATGHTADDQAETVLHRLIRGTGLQGLRGIASERELHPGLRLIRPLLSITRPEILDYLQALGQPWREDASNRDPHFTRNRIRHELLPLLETFNPAVRTILGRLAEQATDAHTEQEATARTLLVAAELPRAGTTIILNATALRSASRPRLRALFRYLWEREAWPLRAMTFDHWNRLVTGVMTGVASCDFPAGVTLRCRKDVVQLQRK